MASAVLASNRNETDWGGPQPHAAAVAGRSSNKFMGKTAPFSNPNSKISKKRHQNQNHNHKQPPQILDVDESAAITQSAASDDASSINRTRTNEFIAGGYVTFNVAMYSKKELIELKSRLRFELDQIRQLKNRIESNTSLKRKSSSYQKPINPNKRGSWSLIPSAENAQLLKKCGQVLSKLMKHKHGYIFNVPVDVVGMQLHDYYDIVKSPMDLGTVKTKLGANMYDSPREFEADVRLTFSNAMRYNPKGHEVYVLAEQLLVKFEELYRPMQDAIGGIMEERVIEEEVHDEPVREVEASSWDHDRGRFHELCRVVKDDTFGPSVSKLEKTATNSVVGSSSKNQNPNIDATTNVNDSKQLLNAAAQLPVRTPSPIRAPSVKPLKQPKPKAKDPNKRDMTLEEKHRLGIGLQNLPPEKMEQVVQIIRKRNGHLRQEGDEIELDIEAVDKETLWELDRFVTNYKKLVSKIKRQALMGINNNNVGPSLASSDGNNDVGNERMDTGNESKKMKKGDAIDEDVDIVDDMPIGDFPPVEIEKDNGHASSSSSSSSDSSDDSSSSSDSDSGSSSGSDSEDAHS